MDKAIKQKWVAALRSGKYRQARCFLMDHDGCMCCLGVLARLQGATLKSLRGKNTSRHEKINGLVPCTVRIYLSDMNDDGKTFPEIADWIEANIPED